jgi:serine phosphatase RsbU (regulator of sigma subunit)/anti-sigma regulatory factor (Ser/Thr protein kinase)
MEQKPRGFLSRFRNRSTQTPALETQDSRQQNVQEADVQPLDIPPDDPLLEVLLDSQGVIEVEQLDLDSPTLQSLREANIKLTLPLVSQGELIGLLNLGPRLSEQEYSTEDKKLLQNLATQAAPALRVAQLARQQQQEARERERLQQELRVARIIQETLLPKEVPTLPGWNLEAYWKPASAVSGDFYDFFEFPDGKIGIVVADVTDKGIPAAMVMATTRSLLRTTAEQLESPGQVLARTNELLIPDIPRNMFVTCLYILLDPSTGALVIANAGHNLPYKRTATGVEELNASGMPLGLMPEMQYDEVTASIQPGENLLLSSDGLVEAHNPAGEMFGFPRMKEIMQYHPDCEGLIQCMQDELDGFTGEDWEQEDDVTLVLIEYLDRRGAAFTRHDPALTLLADFSLPSQPGNERLAMEKVAEALQKLDIDPAHLEKIKTAVAEGTLNAMEHGNGYDPGIPTDIRVQYNQDLLAVSITDHSSSGEIPDVTSPDLDAKLDGQQSPRGWGLFLIKNMVDEMNIRNHPDHHTLELIFKLQGEQNA